MSLFVRQAAMRGQGTLSGGLYWPTTDARVLPSSWIARFCSLGVPLLAVPDLDARRRMESLYIYSVFKITFRRSSKHPIEKKEEGDSAKRIT